MNINLYNYTGDLSIANKIKNLSPVYSGDIIPYGHFDSENVEFRLDTEYVCNYCQYGFNGHTYMGYVDVSVDSEGLYVYSITVDPLTTCWYNRCFQTQNLCEYSDLGSDILFEERALYTPDTTRDYITIKNRHVKDRVILVVSASAILDEDLYESFNNPYYRIYSMSVHDYFVFCGESYTTPYDDFRSSIVKAYLVSSDELQSTVWETADNLQVNLYKPAQTSDERHPYVKACPSGIITLPSLRILRYTGQGPITPEVATVRFEQNISNYPINSWRRKSTFKLYIENMGYIGFNYDDVAEGQTITRIGYIKGFDFVSGVANAILTVNGKVLKDYRIQAAIPNEIMYFDTNYQKYTNDRTVGILTSGIGIAQGIGSMVNPINEFKQNSTTTRVLGKAMNSSKFMHPDAFLARKNMRKKYQQSQKGMWSSVAQAGIGAMNLVNGINGFYQAATKGLTSTTHGSGTGSIDDFIRWGSFLTIEEKPPLNLIDIQSKFGKPDGKLRNVETLTGYVKTQDCILLANGLPSYIVNACKSIADSGFRIQ